MNFSESTMHVTCSSWGREVSQVGCCLEKDSIQIARLLLST